MRHKEDENGGIVAGVTDTFDPDQRLVYDVPDVSAATLGRPSIEIPAYYDLWAQATGDPFWTAAAQDGRAYLQRAANATTGFMPLRATFDGAPYAGDASFASQGFRAQINIALDHVWSAGAAGAWNVAVTDRTLQFLAAQGLDTYGNAFTLDGQVLSATHDAALVMSSGAAATITTVPDRASFVAAVWNAQTPTGSARYFVGLMDLLAQLVLAGQMRVY